MLVQRDAILSSSIFLCNTVMLIIGLFLSHTNLLNICWISFIKLCGIDTIRLLYININLRRIFIFKAITLTNQESFRHHRCSIYDHAKLIIGFKFKSISTASSVETVNLIPKYFMLVLQDVSVSNPLAVSFLMRPPNPILQIYQH